MIEKFRFTLSVFLFDIVFFSPGKGSDYVGNLSSNYSTPQIYPTPPEIIRKYGYVAEIHTIQTEDGYLLEFHRIPCSKQGKPAWRKNPLLFWHGFPSCSIDLIISGPEKGLAFLMADQGYDVWLANARGNTYSQKHITFKPSERRFWNFSFHEMGIYDAPAAVDYILNTTSAQKLIYMGHSLGTATFYVFASCRPEYQDKILIHISIAPIAAIPWTTSIIKLVVPFIQVIKAFADLYYKGALLQHDAMIDFFYKYVCSQQSLDMGFCANFSTFSLYGEDRAQFNATLNDIMHRYVPAGTSAKTAVHASQLIFPGEFRQYDYGLLENLRRYQSAVPPRYDVSSILIPIKFYRGPNDVFADAEDTKILYQQISRPMGFTLINYADWNHIDYLFAIDVKKYFYNSLLKFLNDVTTKPGFIEMSVEKALAKRNQKSTPRNLLPGETDP